MMTDFDMVMARLAENNLAFATLALQNGVTAVVTARGGRILGPFLATGASVTWLNACWADKDAFRDFLKSNVWNQGGDRVWIAPEIQFAVKDRKRFWETLATPPEMDPEEYRISSAPGSCRLEKEFDLPLYYPTQGRKALFIERIVRPAPDPLRYLSGSGDYADVCYAGYSHDITLHNRDDSEAMAESWNLSQVKPGGELHIKIYDGATLTPVDYYEPVDETHQTVLADRVVLKITGKRRYKVGYKAAQVTGRLAYLRHGDDCSLLYIRHFFSNPSSFYNEEPPLSPGVKGFSVHAYNDAGDGGGFGEIEANGQAVGGESGRNVAVDTFVTWMYAGSRQGVETVFHTLMG